MKFFRLTLGLILPLLISLTACGGEEAAVAPPPPSATPVQVLTNPEQATQEAVVLTPTLPPTSAPDSEPTSTPVLSTTPTPSPEPTATNTVIPTLTSTPAPTDTPAPVVQLVPDSDTRINIRSGPGTDYPTVGQLEPGQTVAVIGRNGDNSWWQIRWGEESGPDPLGWVFGELVNFSGDAQAVALVEVAPPPPTSTPEASAAPVAEAQEEDDDDESEAPAAPEELAEQLDCGKDFCVTYQAMVPMHENGGCVGNHSIYITVLEGPPPGQPMDGVVIGDTFNNVEVGSGSHGPGRTEITLWNNSMTLIAKRHQNGTPYTSEESFNFTSHDELIPAEVLAANGYCEGSVEKCRVAQQHNQVCRGHYSWRVTFHKFD